MRSIFAACLLAGLTPGQQSRPGVPPELGRVRWERDYAVALGLARQQQRPVFLLFQEIPGCDTCTSFGKDVLSHPLLVPAIEGCFVPVVVRNNVSGQEQKILERYAEPAWNHPVVRFVDAQGDDLLPRADRVWDAHGIATRMVAALRAAKRPVPGYLLIARDEHDPATATAVFAMHCFWEGEAVLGALPGVVATRAAFVGSAEVVEVRFLPALLPQAELQARAEARSCKPIVATLLREAEPADQKHALTGTPYARLRLTPMQAMRVHAALTLRTDPKLWLTPAQVAALDLR